MTRKRWVATVFLGLIIALTSLTTHAQTTGGPTEQRRVKCG